MDCVVVAPSKIPQQTGNRLKNDRRDCLSLARLHRAGELTPVYVPTEEDEALRDLLRAREDVIRALRTAKQQLTAQPEGGDTEERLRQGSNKRADPAILMTVQQSTYRST